MNTLPPLPHDPRGKASRAFGVASLVLGLVALLGRLGFEAARADLGADLGIDVPWIRALLHLGSFAASLLGLSCACAATATASSWRLRVGLPLPGVLVNGMAILWFALWT